MFTKCKKSGLTLTEMAVVAAIIGLLVALGIPAVRTVVHSFESESGTRSMIASALASARAIAANRQQYAGIRFQPDAEGRQHMIFIIHDPAVLARGFRAVPGAKPMALPPSVAVMDMRVRANRAATVAACSDPNEMPLDVVHLDDTDPANLDPNGSNVYLYDTRTFSIVFSPAGRVVSQVVRVRNRQGIYQPDNSVAAKTSTDDVFNSLVNIEQYNRGRFIQDDYPPLGLGAEHGRHRFVICNRLQMDDATAQERFDHLRSLEPIYVSPYTGELLETN